MIVRAEWPGTLVDILVSPGQEVEEDEALLLFEGTDASHTPFYINAPEAGRVVKIYFEEGDYVDEDDDVLELADID